MNNLNFTPEQWILWIADYGFTQAGKDIVNPHLQADKSSLNLSVVANPTLKREETIILRGPEPLEIRVEELIRISSKIFTQHFDKIDGQNLKKWQNALRYLKKDHVLNPASLDKLARIEQGIQDLITDRTKTIEGLNKYRVLKNCMKKLQALTPRELASFSENLTTQMNQTVEDIFKIRDLETAKIQQMKNNFTLLSSDLSQYENSRLKAFQEKNFVSKFKGTINELIEEYKKLSHQVLLLESHRNRSGSLLMQDEFNLIKSALAKIAVKLPLYEKLEAFVVFFYEKIESNRIQPKSVEEVQTKLAVYFQRFRENLRENQLDGNRIALYLEDCQSLIDMIVFLDDLCVEFQNARLTPQFNEQMTVRIQGLKAKVGMYNNDLQRVEAGGAEAWMHRDIMLSKHEHKEMTNLKNRWDQLKDILKERDLTQFNEHSIKLTTILVAFIEGATTVPQCRESIDKLNPIKLTSEEHETLTKKIKDNSYDVYKLGNCLNNFKNLVANIDPTLAILNSYNEASTFCQDSQRTYWELRDNLPSLQREFDSQQKKLAYIHGVDQQLENINKKSTVYTGIFDEVNSHIKCISKYNLTTSIKTSLAEIYKNFIQGKFSLDEFNQKVQSLNTRLQLNYHQEDLDSLIQKLQLYKGDFTTKFMIALVQLHQISNAHTGDPTLKIAELAETCDRVKEVISLLEDNTIGKYKDKFEEIVLQRLNKSIDREKFITNFRTILKTHNAAHVDMENLMTKRGELQNLLGLKKATTNLKELSKAYKSWCLKFHPDKVGADKTLEQEKNEQSKGVIGLFTEIKQVCSDLPEDFTF